MRNFNCILLIAFSLMVINCTGNSTKEQETTDTIKAKADSIVPKKHVVLKDTILSFQGIEIGSLAKEAIKIIKSNPEALPSSDDYIRYMYSIHPFSYFNCEEINRLACSIYFGHELTQYYTKITTEDGDALGYVKIYTCNDTIKTIRISFPGYYEGLKKILTKCYGKEYTKFGSVKDFKNQQFTKYEDGFEHHEGCIWRFKHQRIILAEHGYNRDKMSEIEKECTDEDELLEKQGVELVYEDYDYYLSQLKEEKKIEKEIQEEEKAEEKKRLENVNNQRL